MNSMKNRKKATLFLIIVSVMTMLLSMSVMAFAEDKNDSYDPAKVLEDIQNDNGSDALKGVETTTKQVMHSVISIGTFIGAGLALLAVIVLGIRFVNAGNSGSGNRMDSLKDGFGKVLIGVFLIGGASAIVGLIFTLANTVASDIEKNIETSSVVLLPMLQNLF